MDGKDPYHNTRLITASPSVSLAFGNNLPLCFERKSQTGYFITGESLAAARKW